MRKNKNDKRPNIILILFDSMRAKNVSCYGYRKKTTPNLDRVASIGTKFTNAFVQAPFTVASTASILTCVYPSVHRLEYYGQQLSKSLITFPELLEKAGYKTAGFVANPHINPVSGLTRGFNYFTDGRPWYKYNRISSRFVAWAESGKALNQKVKKEILNSDNTPFFFFIFYNDSHVPFSGLPRVFLPLIGKKYHTPAFEKYSYTDKQLARVIDLYNLSLQRADKYFGNLLYFFHKTSKLENTNFIITADHGEGLDPRQERSGHGRLYDSGIHVPFIILEKQGIARQKTVDELVTSLDIAPTICEWAEINYPEHWQGNSLLAILEGKKKDKETKYVISEYHDSRCVRTSQWKTIHHDGGIGVLNSQSEGDIELYNLKSSTKEDEDVSHSYPDIVAEHVQILNEFVAGINHSNYHPTIYEADDLMIDRLRGLGYLN